VRGKAAQHAYVYDDAWDQKHGVDTAGALEVEELGGIEGDPDDARGYEPTPPELFEFLVEQSRIGDRTRYAFIDLGSGKGRVLLLAGLAGFRKVVGVEFGADLHAVAVRNIQKLRSQGMTGDVTAVLGDARTFQFPPGPTLCFLNNPFGAEVLERVIENIETSLAADPRPFSLIYYHSNHAHLLHGRRGWERVDHGAWPNAPHHYELYRWAGREEGASWREGPPAAS